jgi:c-di-GMP-binding flagellar brake protein YcgR
MRFIEERDYKRSHLRAPYKEHVLYVDDNFVFKAHTLNISEGGMLLDLIPHFPDEETEVPLMISLPQYPYFKNFTLQKLKSFSKDMFTTKVVRLKCKMVRKFGIQSKVDHAFTSRVGVRFTDIKPMEKKLIADYVNVFSSNLIYLQVLIDSMYADKSNLEKIRLLSQILNYEEDIKISQLRRDVQQDYISLQWL